MKSDLDLAKALARKAENDLKIARIAFEHEGPLDMVAFHVQQAAEKMLKALIASRGVDYPRTHDLRALINLATTEVPELERFRERLLPLNAYAVEMRYDDALDPDSEEVSNALSTSEELRDAVLDLLPPDARP